MKAKGPPQLLFLSDVKEPERGKPHNVTIE